MRHPIDLASAALIRWGPERMKFFTEGWGDEDLLMPPDIEHVPAEPIAVEWLSSEQRDGYELRHGTFKSPAPALPRRAERGSVVAVLPETVERVVLLMPAWNEHEPTVRLGLAEILARRGFGSILLENAFFGSRHPHAIDEPTVHPIKTVADFMVMGVSAVIEARGLLAWLEDEGHRVGVSGYSMGANTAALVAGSYPRPLAVAALAASYSPSPVFMEGILRHGISWGALGGEEEAEDRLAEVLLRPNALALPARPHLSTAVVVGARTDAYIPAHATEDLATHWGAELRWHPGGHATLVWRRKDLLAKAVEDSFTRFEARAPLTSSPLGPRFEDELGAFIYPASGRSGHTYAWTAPTFRWESIPRSGHGRGEGQLRDPVRCVRR